MTIYFPETVLGSGDTRVTVVRVPAPILVGKLMKTNKQVHVEYIVRSTVTKRKAGKDLESVGAGALWARVVREGFSEEMTFGHRLRWGAFEAEQTDPDFSGEAQPPCTHDWPIIQ